MGAIEVAEAEVRKLAEKHAAKGSFLNLWGTKRNEPKECVRAPIGGFAAKDGPVKPWVCYTLADGRPVKANRFVLKTDALRFGKRQREHYRLPSGMKAEITTCTVQVESRMSRNIAAKLPQPKEFKAKAPEKEQLRLGI